MTDLDLFAQWLRVEQYAPASRKGYLIYARLADRWLHTEGGCLDTANTADLLAWLATLPQTATSRAYARHSLIAYYRHRDADPNPAAPICNLPRPDPLPRPLTVEEHRAWLDAAHQLGGIHRTAGLLMATTGVRIGELRHAAWSDMCLEGQAPWWRIRGKGAHRRGPRWRQQPLHPAVVELLVEWRSEGLDPVWVFPGRTGPLCDTQMRKYLIAIGYAAKLGRVVPHRIRHTVATTALSNTGNLRATQVLLGHSSVSSTERYTAVLPDRLRDVVNDLPV